MKKEGFEKVANKSVLHRFMNIRAKIHLFSIAQLYIFHVLFVFEYTIVFCQPDNLLLIIIVGFSNYILVNGTTALFLHEALLTVFSGSL